MTEPPDNLDIRDVRTSLWKRVGQYLLAVGEEIADIALSLLSLVVVGRIFGSEGLGIYSFLLSLYVIGSYLSEPGAGKFIERELAMGRDSGNEHLHLLADVRQVSVFSGLTGAAGVMLFAFFHARGSQMDLEFGWNYIVLAAAVALSVYNSFVGSALHGSGGHEYAFRMTIMKRAAFFAAVLGLSISGVRPSFVTAAFLLAEALSAVYGRKRLKLPAIDSRLLDLSRLKSTLNKTSAYYFTGEAFRVVLFLDFFVLGVFESAERLGAYSEASILARLLLLAPLGAAPVLRERFYVLAGREGQKALAQRCRVAAGRIFYFHSVVAVIFLLNYPSILNRIFPQQWRVPESFRIFRLLLPGLLYYGAASMLEPVYAVEQRAEKLGTVALRIFILNGFLNFYLVPYAGVFGAAFATSLSLTAYFLLIGGELDPMYRLPKVSYIIAGALAYLAYRLFAALNADILFTVPGVIALLYALFFMAGLFTGGDETTDR